MKINCRKLNGALVPVDEPDREALKKVKTGQTVTVEMKKPRNPHFHRKYFALLGLVFDNQEKYESFAYFLNEIKFRIGHVDQFIIDGKMVFQPRSISFAAMDDYAFADFYSKTIDVILKHFIPAWSADEIDRLVNQIVQFG
jgi:hypothetical protein